jgi:hypothetical protein
MSLTKPCREVSPFYCLKLKYEIDAKSRIFPALERSQQCDFCLIGMPLPGKGFLDVKILIPGLAFKH